MKTCPVGAEKFHADRYTKTVKTKILDALRYFGDAPFTKQEYYFGMLSKIRVHIALLTVDARDRVFF
jgi:hypothetical protein